MTTSHNNDDSIDHEIDDGSRGLSTSRRGLIAGTALGLTGLAVSGSTNAAAASSWEDHDHSGDFGGKTDLGASSPVSSITVNEVLTKQSPRRNVKAHGAVGDGSTDDTTAIQTTLDGADDGDIIYFPPGNYLCSSKLTQSGKSLSLVGGGIGVSKITFNNSDGGFDLDIPRPTDSSGNYTGEAPGNAHVKGLSIITTQSNGGTALDISWPFVDSAPYTHAVVRDVELRGDARNSTGWTRGIKLREAWHCLIDGVSVANAGKDTSLYGLELQGRSIAVGIRDFETRFAKDGILLNGRNEGFRLRGGDFVATQYGVRAGPNYHGHPQFVARDCHANVGHTAFDLGPIKEGAIAGNDIWNVQYDTSSSAELVTLEGANEVSIVNNQLVAQSAGIDIKTGSDIFIQGNHIEGRGSEVPLRGEDLEHVIATDNKFTGTPDYAMSFNRLIHSRLVGNVYDNDNEIYIVNSQNVDVSNQGRQHWPLVKQSRDSKTSTPGELGLTQTYGQSFTVDSSWTRVDPFVANYNDWTSAVDVTVYEGEPGSGLTQLHSVTVDPLPNNERTHILPGTLSSGTYYVEMDNPSGSVTWWWHDGASGLASVGGSAYVDRTEQTNTNFCFRVLD